MRASTQYSSTQRRSPKPSAGDGVPMDQVPQQELVLKHADLVKRIAYHLVSRMPPNVEVDDLLQSDWTPRSVHRNMRQMADVIRKIENEKGQDATPTDIAGGLGVSIEEYHKLVQDAASCRLFSFDQMSSSEDESSPADHARDEGPGPLDHIEDAGFRDAMASAIDGLPERERLVLSLYYDEDMNLREIGEVLEVSESRVCQIHGQALVRVRARLAEW